MMAQEVIKCKIKNSKSAIFYIAASGDSSGSRVQKNDRNNTIKLKMPIH